jgi:hypothetical protein
MNLYRVLKRDVGKEFAVSRNLGESRLTGCLRATLCVWFIAKALCLGVRAMRREQLGSQVTYDGKRCSIVNWAGSDNPHLAGDGFYIAHVPRREIRNIINAKELWHRFSFGVEFYTGYHMNNDINKRLYPAAFAR